MYSSPKSLAPTDLKKNSGVGGQDFIPRGLSIFGVRNQYLVGFVPETSIHFSSSEFQNGCGMWGDRPPHFSPKFLVLNCTQEQRIFSP
jgi:hypothetical protein